MIKLGMLAMRRFQKWECSTKGVLVSRMYRPRQHLAVHAGKVPSCCRSLGLKFSTALARIRGKPRSVVRATRASRSAGRKTSGDPECARQSVRAAFRDPRCTQLHAAAPCGDVAVLAIHGAHGEERP